MKFDKFQFIENLLKPLQWYEYNLKHEYGTGSLETNTNVGTFEILYRIDENNLKYYFCKQIMTNFNDIEQAKFAYWTYYVSRIVGSFDTDKCKDLVSK